MSDSYEMSTSNQYIKYKISMSQNSQDINGNRSNVTVSVSFWRTNTEYETFGNGTVYCKINGVTYSQPVNNNQKITNSAITLFSTTLNIPHDADGQKILSVSAWISHDRFSSGEQQFDWRLTTIPRASQPSCITRPDTTNDVGEMGKTITIHMNKQANFTHTVRYGFGNKSGTIASGVVDSVDWTIPTSLAAEIPNDDSGWGAIYVDTYSGSTLIGTRHVTFTTHAPASMVPAINSIDLSDAMTYEVDYNAYVQGKSKITVNVNASGVSKSTIAKVSISVDGVTVTQNPYTTNPVVKTGVNEVTVTVTDTRGRSATSSKNYEVLPYQSPTIDSCSVVRCDVDGTLNDAGEYAKIHVTAKTTDLNGGNAGYYSVWRRSKGETDWTRIGSVDAEFLCDKDFIAAVDTECTHEIKLSVSDDFGVITQTLPLGTAFTLVDYNASGKGMAIGKVSEKDALEIDIPMYIKNMYMFGVNIIDYFYPVGTQIYNSQAWYDPNNIFTGTTWKRIKGVVLAGVDDTDTDTNLKTSFNQTEGTVIGSKRMQKHAHGFDKYGLNHTFKWGGNDGTVYIPENAVGGNGGNGGNNYLNTVQNTDNGTMSFGEGDAENIQPTMLTYIWERIK